MIVEATVTVNGSKEAVWAAITNIEGAATIITGIQKIEIVEKPAKGLVGLRWRETRLFFGKPATVEKWITDAAENTSYKTRAESDGQVFVSAMSIAETGAGTVTLTAAHDSKADGFVRTFVMIVMGPLFKRVAKKAILKDLNDIKSAVEHKG